MKQPALGLAIAAVAFAGSSLYLWAQLRQERARVVQVEETTRELNARIAELEKARTQIPEHRQVNATGMISGQFGQLRAVVPPANPSPPVGESKMAGQEQFWTVQPERSEAFQKMARSQMRGHNKRLYADLADELGLSKETADKLIDLITDQQTAGFEAPHGFKDPTESRRYFEDKQRENEAAISALIGTDKALALQEYQKSLPARMEFEMLSQQLAGNDVTLSEDQTRKLREVYIEERMRVPMPDYVEGADHGTYFRQFHEWQQDYEDRVSAEASHILNSEQLSAYNEIQEWQREMRMQIGATPPAGRGLVTGNAVMYNAASGTVAAGAPVTIAVPAPAEESPKKP